MRGDASRMVTALPSRARDTATSQPCWPPMSTTQLPQGRLSAVAELRAASSTVANLDELVKREEFYGQVG